MLGMIKDASYIYNGVKVDYSYFTNVDITKKIMLVNSVTDYVVNEENKNYYSILKEMMFNFELIEIFTDIDLSEFYEVDENENELNKIESFLTETDIVKTIKDNADIGVIEGLIQAVNDNISYRTGVRQDFLATLISKLAIFSDTMTNIVNDMDKEELVDKMQQLSNMVTEINDVTKEMEIN